jgi:hypothetical protein
MGSLTAGLAFSMVMTISPQFAKADDQIAADAAKGRPLTVKELDSIYQDRTWPWENGAAYFRAENRGFVAWVGERAQATYAEGTWSATDQGRLCFSAVWHSRGGNAPSTTCWEHRSDDKNIYQRKLPDGQWYIFSHLPALSDDAIQKLQPGDHVSKDYQVNKTYLAQHKDPIADEAANGRALTGKELDRIFEGRSWPWGDGAAYFRPANRGFIAWVGKGFKASYADGTWSVNDQGRLCFDAIWHGNQGKHSSTTCWEHRSDDRNIYQRKIPDGRWDIFSHLPPLPDDAINKLHPGDRVSENYQANKRYLAKTHTRKKRK